MAEPYDPEYHRQVMQETRRNISQNSRFSAEKATRGVKVSRSDRQTYGSSAEISHADDRRHDGSPTSLTLALRRHHDEALAQEQVCEQLLIALEMVENIAQTRYITEACGTTSAEGDLPADPSCL